MAGQFDTHEILVSDRLKRARAARGDMLAYGPGIVSHVRIHRDRVQRSAGILPAVARASCPRTRTVAPVLLILAACVGLSACPNSNAPTPITYNGPSVQIVE